MHPVLGGVSPQLETYSEKQPSSAAAYAKVIAVQTMPTSRAL